MQVHTTENIMWCKEEFDIYPRRDRDKSSRHVRIELPPPFSGDEKQSFLCWARQFEVAVRALTEDDGTASYNYELARILPTRLTSAAFLLWDSLPGAVQSDYTAVKDKLKEAFGQRQFMDRFRATLSARPRAPRESLEVYAAEISRLVDDAFPEYGEKAQKEEKFRRFLAGLDPVLRTKCHEQGATDLGEAVIIAGRCENARDVIKTDYMAVNAAHSDGDEGAVAAINSGSGRDNAGLYRAVERLADEMRDMRIQLRRLGDENQKLNAKVNSKTMEDWQWSRSQSNGLCQCCCGGRGCQSQRGRSPERQWVKHSDRYKSGTDYGDVNDSYSMRYPLRRSPSPSPRRRNSYEDDSRKRGVRFMSPGAGERHNGPGNGL